MDVYQLPIGTKLRNEHGTWTIVNVTNYDGDIWYDLRGERGEVVAFPYQIGKQYTMGEAAA